MFGGVTTVAVTTSEDRIAGMASELVAVGLQPVSLPCIGIQVGRPDDLARARAACEEADLVVLTSSRPLALLWPHGPVPATPMAVVGPATATAVAERGGNLSYVGTGTALDLANDLLDTLGESTVAYPHSVSSDPRAIVAMKDAAARLTAVPVYGTVPIAPPTIPVDAAVFVSAPAVHGWATNRSFTGLVIGALGQSVCATLERYDRRPDVRVRSHTYSELTEALVRYLG